ncbi:hypothetical protein BD324DRAFT_615344 [Kockovaella imperatae]|uniref:Tafazzin family protein n=1 Tax=Kockovaella imperatae TaxID=4999 RepID=A0A1Y1UQN2_9TREE|nr:hypothetical protein BD324DRAFT_615344 [Kockovaella imperatae]ORX39877.1 hypothetical protein BD324DRAFT_615344 [Kockovaella imperatae]
MAPTLISGLTLSATALLFRAVARARTTSFNVQGLPILLEALKARDAQLDIKGKGKALYGVGESTDLGTQGILTVCNHNSVVDDPMAWASMPITTYMPFASPSSVSRNSRWTLGARDIMFTNAFLRKFFAWGQVLDTERGGGIFQPAVDEAIKILQSGGWLHIFPEGKVNQRNINPEGGLIRFKWGVSRILMDSKTLPEIIPMWISGFDTVMPEPRSVPKWLPRRGGKVTVTYGQPVTDRIRPLIDEWRRLAGNQQGTVGVGGVWEKQGSSPSGQEQRRTREAGRLADGHERTLRIKICEVLQESVRKLGEAVERGEGRFERGEWCQSVAGINRQSKS